MKRQLKILICEDNAIIALSLTDLVEQLGHKCLGPAARSDRAIEIANAETPDLALIDLNLADGWTGPGLVEYFQQHGTVCAVISGQTESFENDGPGVRVFEKPVNERLLEIFIEDLASSRDTE